MRKLLVLLVLAGCHKDSPVGTYDLAAPQAPPDLATPPAATPLMTLDSKKVDLAAYRKKVTLIALWGTFCEPCMQEMPFLEALYQRTKGDTDLAIIGVSTDEVQSDGDRAHVADVAGKLKVTFPMLIDKGGVLSARFSHKDGDAPAAAADGGAATGLNLPTAIFLLADGHFTRHSGFDPNVPPDTFVSDGMATIALAETGTLPREDYDASPPPSDTTKGTFKMMLPAVPKADFAAKWPLMKAELKNKMRLSDKAIADAESQLKTGGPAVIEITPPKK